VSYIFVFGHGSSTGGIVVAGVKAQVLRLLLGGLWTLDYDRLDGRRQQFRIMHVRTVDRHAQRAAVFVADQAAFGTIFRSIRGVRADFIPPKRALAMAPSALCHSQPTPSASPHSSTRTAMILPMIPALFQR